MTDVSEPCTSALIIMFNSCSSLLRLMMRSSSDELAPRVDSLPVVGDRLGQGAGVGHRARLRQPEGEGGQGSGLLGGVRHQASHDQGLAQERLGEVGGKGPDG